MAAFECKIYKIIVEKHPNADKLELVRIGDYYSIIQKDSMKTGDLAVYIPEASILPEDLIQELGLENRLKGKAKNRVKAVRLRGVVSQGLVYPVSGNGTVKGRRVALGEDIRDILGIKKYEPPIPTNMSGDLEPMEGLLNFDIENVKKYPHVFRSGEAVVITEKLHGSWTCFGWSKVAKRYFATSKGYSAKGMVFRETEKNLQKNLYCRLMNENREKLERFRDHILSRFQTDSIFLLGEIHGPRVQDLTYGESKAKFRAFDIYIGNPGKGEYLSWEEFYDNVSKFFDIVPILYQGLYSKDILLQYTRGETSLNGGHVREGCVIKPLKERYDLELGRVILKSISEDFLFRKGNTTDYI